MRSQVHNISDLNMDDTELLIVDFYAPWCAPCLSFAPIYERVAGEFAQNFTFAKANVDDSMEIARRFNVSSIPTIIVFNKGRVIARYSGALSDDALKKALRGVLQHLSPEKQSAGG